MPLLLALAREDAALGLLERDSAATTRPAAGRPPIAQLCFSRIAQRDPYAPERQVRLLDALLAAGADANAGAPVEGDRDHPLSPLYGAIGHASNLPLAEALLARGADPNDDESLYHASEIEQEGAALAALRLLFANGGQVGATNAFLRMLDRECPEGVRLFLDNGADPSAPPYRHPSDAPAERRNALHHAILRGRSGAIGGLLIDAGVDTAMRYDGKSPYALARVCGDADMAAILAERGLATDLSRAETFLARLAEGNEEGARAILADHPDLWSGVTERGRTRQNELAMRREALPTLRAMAALGFEIDLPGEGAMPPVHAAAWWGHAEIVEMYVDLGARLDWINEFGGDALGTAIHGSANCPGRREGDYERTVRALLDGGAVIRPEAGHLEMGSEAVTLMLEAEMAARPGK